jgi:hypothetical protein
MAQATTLRHNTPRLHTSHTERRNTAPRSAAQSLVRAGPPHYTFNSACRHHIYAASQPQRLLNTCSVLIANSNERPHPPSRHASSRETHHHNNGYNNSWQHSLLNIPLLTQENTLLYRQASTKTSTNAQHNLQLGFKYFATHKKYPTAMTTY